MMMRSILRKLAPRCRTRRHAVSIEQPESLTTGRPLPSHPDATLRIEHAHRLFEHIAAASKAIQVRIDLTHGLSRSGIELVNACRETGLAPWVAISPFAAGDMTVHSQGQTAIDPRLWPLLKVLAGPERKLLLLNELADAFSQSQADPWALYVELERQFSANGLTATGWATALTRPTCANQLGLLMLHAGVWEHADEPLINAFGLLGVEMLRPTFWKRPGHEPLHRWPDHDRISRLRIEPSEQDEHQRCGFRPTAAPPWRITAATHYGATLVSDTAGWRYVDAEGQEQIADEPLDTIVQRLSEANAARVVLDPHLFAQDTRNAPRPAAGEVRPLPFPFTHALSFSSDIDWSTPPQAQAAFARLNEELGLPVAGSFVLHQHDDPWVAATDPPHRGAALGDVAQLNARGAFDTLHAWSMTIQQLGLSRTACGAWQCRTGDATIRPAAVIIRHRNQVMPASVVIHIGDTEYPASRLPDGPGAPGDHTFTCYVLPRTIRKTTHASSIRIATPTDADDTIDAVELIDLDPDELRACIGQARADHIRPLVFTSHGGGRSGTMQIGNLHVGEMAPQPHDLDQAASPFHLLPDLLRWGVRFLSPIGSASTQQLTPIANLVKPMTLRDGATVGVFARWLSRRVAALGFTPRWVFGKNAANTAALPFQINDFLQRSAWCPTGCAAALYTHLGHRIGNQLQPRLGWDEPTHQTLERLADHYHPDADARSQRIWVGPTASLVLFAHVSQQVAEHITLDGAHAAIEPWQDEVLSRRDQPLQLSTRLLHGLTLYHPDPKTATLSIGGRHTDSYTRNSPDATGAASITIVDDTAVRRLAFRGQVLRQEASGGRIEVDEEGLTVLTGAADGEAIAWLYPVALDAATHWSFRADRPGESPFGIALRDQRGQWYEASTDASAHRQWLLEPAIGDRHVLSFQARSPHPMGPPQRAVTAVRLRWRQAGDGASIRVYGMALHRHRPDLGPTDEPALLVGRVRCPAPLDLSSAIVRCVSSTGRFAAEVTTDGHFVVRDLPRDQRVEVRLVIHGAEHISKRGRTAIMTCDQTDWDFALAPVEAER